MPLSDRVRRHRHGAAKPCLALPLGPSEVRGVRGVAQAHRAAPGVRIRWFIHGAPEHESGACLTQAEKSADSGSAEAYARQAALANAADRADPEFMRFAYAAASDPAEFPTRLRLEWKFS